MHVAAERLGGGHGLGDGGAERLVVVVGEEEDGHDSTPASLELGDELGRVGDLDAGLAARRLDGLQHLEARRDVDAEVGGLLDVERLLLRLHDVGQRGIARLVEAQVGGDDRRQLELQRLQAAVDLARHERALALDHELGGERRLRPAEQRRQHLAGLIAVVVDRLLAEDDEARLLRVDHALEDLGDRQRLDRLAVGRFDEDAAVGAHRQRGADGLLRLGRADGDGDDLRDHALLLQPHRLLDGDLVEGVHRHLDVGELDARPVGLDADLDVVSRPPALRRPEPSFPREAPSSEARRANPRVGRAAPRFLLGPAILCLVYDGRRWRFASAKRRVGRQQLGVNWATGAALWTTVGQRYVLRRSRTAVGADQTGVMPAVEQRNARPAHEQDQYGAGSHAADMRPPGHLIGLVNQHHDQLGGDPHAQHPGRRDPQGDEAERQHPNQHARMQHEIGGDHAGNRPAGADQRQLGGRQHAGVGKPAGDAAHQIEDQELDVAHGVLDVVAEHPQEQHVGGEVQDVAMQEHVGEERVALRHGERVVRPARRPAEDLTWNSSVGTSAKLAAAVGRAARSARRRPATLAAMRPTVTHWKRIERSGLSSERGMKTTACYLCYCASDAEAHATGSAPAPTRRRLRRAR